MNTKVTFPSTVLPFLNELKLNNNREWFAANRNKYETAKSDFEAFAQELIHAISEYDKDISHNKAKDCVFRIYRDTRFSKDTSPYKTNMGAWIVKGGKKSPYAGYYLHIDSEGCFLAGGIHMPEKEILKAIRDGIFNHFSDFKNVIDKPSFRNHYPSLSTDRLKKNPLGYPADFEGIEYLKLKEFTVSKIISEDDLHTPGFFQDIVEAFRIMKPFLDFLNEALNQAH